MLSATVSLLISHSDIDVGGIDKVVVVVVGVVDVDVVIGSCGGG